MIPLRRPSSSLAASAALLASAALGAEQRLCEPSREIQQEIERAAAAAPPSALFDQATAPFRVLRDRFPEDLFVHMRYQDAVADNGIEGHLKEMLAEYAKLRVEHPDDIFYVYLHGRALEGRVTPIAVRIMNEILAGSPNFAPALRTLAEIYGSTAFRDRKKQTSARAMFEAACPGSVVAHRPSPLPPHSTLFTDPQGRLERNRNPDDVPGQVHRALQQDEWRSQRMRSFDWYGVAEKRQAVQELQAEYWKGWRILVQHYRRIGQPEEANLILSEMQHRLTRSQADPSSKLFWVAAASLLDLYSQGRQQDKIVESLAEIEASIAAGQNRKGMRKLSQLRVRYGLK
jgi:streptomycin 6-kinase